MTVMRTPKHERSQLPRSSIKIQDRLLKRIHFSRFFDPNELKTYEPIHRQ